MHGTRPGRDRHELRRILLESFRFMLYTFSKFHQTAGVSHTGRGSEDDRRFELLGNIHAGHQEVARVRGIRRLQDGYFGQPCVIACILLILRGVHSRIVRHDSDQSAHCSHIRQGHQRIRGHVQADVLHGHNGTGPRITGTGGHLKGDLLIR